MRKIRLEPLRVESFETAHTAPLSGGTVQGAMAATTLPCPSFNPCLPSWQPTGCEQMAAGRYPIG